MAEQVIGESLDRAAAESVVYKADAAAAAAARPFDTVLAGCKALESQPACTGTPHGGSCLLAARL